MAGLYIPNKQRRAAAAGQWVARLVQQHQAEVESEISLAVLFYFFIWNKI